MRVGCPSVCASDFSAIARLIPPVAILERVDAFKIKMRERGPESAGGASFEPGAVALNQSNDLLHLAGTRA